jgi:hypothetical protein
MSVRQLAREIAINKNTAWCMSSRIRRASMDHGELLRGIVEFRMAETQSEFHSVGGIV